MGDKIRKRDLNNSMDYKKKRKKVKLSAYTVAKELGVDFDKYKLVEEGKISLEKDLLDKFLEITQPEKAKEIIFNRKQTIREIKDFIKNDNIPRLMKTRGYKTQKDLAGALGISTTPINQILNFKDKACVSDDMFEMVYEFLKNPLNNYIEGVTKKYKEQENTALTEEENKYYTELMDVNFITRKKVAHDLGYSVSSVNNLFGKTYYGGQQLNDLFKDYMNQYEFPGDKDDVVDSMQYVAEPLTTHHTYTPFTPVTPEHLTIGDNIREEFNHIENDFKITTEAFDNYQKSVFDNILKRYEDQLHEAEKKIERYEKIIDRLLKEGK